MPALGLKCSDLAGKCIFLQEKGILRTKVHFSVGFFFLQDDFSSVCSGGLRIMNRSLFWDECPVCLRPRSICSVDTLSPLWKFMQTSGLDVPDVQETTPERSLWWGECLADFRLQNVWDQGDWSKGTDLHPFCWTFKHLEGTENCTKKPMFTENQRLLQKTAGNRRPYEVSLLNRRPLPSLRGGKATPQQLKKEKRGV